MLAAFGVTAFASYCTRKRREAEHADPSLTRGVGTSRTTTVIAFGLASALIAPSALSVFEFDRLAARTDNRVVVSRWFDTHVLAGASIAQSGSTYGYAQFTPGRFNPWVWEGNRFVTIDYATRVRRPVAGKPDYILLQESPLPNATQDEIKALLAQSYLPVTKFPALDLAAPHIYDMQDAFFIPFAQFTGVERPGPNFTLYKYVGQ
jgi:hypothetical protein